MSIEREIHPRHLSWTPASRRNDLATSHKAEAEINLGSRAKRARQVLELVKMYPNRTHGEISRKWFDRGYEMPKFRDSFSVIAATPHKRLPDLEKLGLVERGPVRKCTDSGKDCATWHITPKGEREIANK